MNVLSPPPSAANFQKKKTKGCFRKVMNDTHLFIVDLINLAKLVFNVAK